MQGYTKLFQDIVTSTIWREKDSTRIVWITMLALADRDGLVMASVPGLADMAKVSLNETVQALEVLKSPDEWSRSKEHEGRRIADADGGWHILNHAKYRDRMNLADRRAYLAQKQREYREKLKRLDSESGLTPKKLRPLPGQIAHEKMSAQGATDAELDRIVESHLPETKEHPED